MSSFFQGLAQLSPNRTPIAIAKSLIDKKIAELIAYCAADIALNTAHLKAGSESLHPLIDKMAQQSIVRFYVHLELKRHIEYMKLYKHPANKEETNK